MKLPSPIRTKKTSLKVGDLLRRQPVTKVYFLGMPLLTLKRESRRRSVSRSVSGRSE